MGVPQCASPPAPPTPPPPRRWAFALLPVIMEKLLNTLACPLASSLTSPGCIPRGAWWVRGQNPHLTKKETKAASGDPEREVTCPSSYRDAWWNLRHPPGILTSGFTHLPTPSFDRLLPTPVCREVVGLGSGASGWLFFLSPCPGSTL